jgi:hypothetical protein
VSRPWRATSARPYLETALGVSGCGKDGGGGGKSVGGAQAKPKPQNASNASKRGSAQRFSNGPNAAAALAVAFAVATAAVGPAHAITYAEAEALRLEFRKPPVVGPCRIPTAAS